MIYIIEGPMGTGMTLTSLSDKSLWLARLDKILKIRIYKLKGKPGIIKRLP